MKLLWVNTNFLHPTTKGGQIRTLGILRYLSKRHEIHYVAFANPKEPEGPVRASEYCARAYPIPRRFAGKRSPRFLAEAARNCCFSGLPLAVSRFQSAQVGALVERLLKRERFDRAVVDHLAPTSHFPDLGRAVFFQHNVETMIWRRHLEHARNPLSRWYLSVQAARMCEYERRVSREAGHIVAVSEIDAQTMRQLFGVERISVVPTGVDLEYFAPPPAYSPVADLSFVGSMDWQPNVDGVQWFVRDILPLIREKRPETSLAIAGRMPPPAIRALAALPRVEVTGTVADIRPYFWGAAVAIVPLRIGGGTRLKIYEAMAAGTAVVSTSIGAEGLDVHPNKDIRIADSPREFAEHCLDLLEDRAASARLARAGRELVRAGFSWERIAERFERVLADQQPSASYHSSSMSSA